MPDIIATWDNFQAGHWGNYGPSAAPENSWGGVNMVLAKDGSLTPFPASRWFQFSIAPLGKVWGVFWAWGADGRVYFVQQAATSTVTSRIYRFTPSPSSTYPETCTLTTVTTFTHVPTTDPDWVEVGTTIYVTMYGKNTYTLGTAGPTMIPLTGNYGAAPAGRAITTYQDRLVVGGVSDARFGTVGNRLVFSGDVTGFGGGNPNTADRTAWESNNYVDIGNDGDVIVGLYNLRDFLVIVMDDQSMYLGNGTPGPATFGGNFTVRRVYGFNKGSGGLTAFLPMHGAVDPSQTRLWMFDHANRAPQRFNGATLTRVNQFGAPHADREGDDLTEGALTMIGGPDEMVVHGVQIGRAGGEGVYGQQVELVRVNGVWMPALNSIIARREVF